MPSFRVRAFRGLRFVPGRVELASVIAWGSASHASGSDPRHVMRLLDDAKAGDDGKDAPLRRAKLRLAEWQRAGLMKRDAEPAVYALKKRTDDGEALGVFCALSVESADNNDDVAHASAGDTSAAAAAARFDALGVSVLPVVAGFDEARVKRTLENAVDREADAAWKIGHTSFEMWCVDEESTTARIATLLSQAPVVVTHNADTLAAHASWWKRAGAGHEDEEPRAGAYALAFLHPIDEPWAEVPVGAALAPLAGPLVATLR